jgi:hypothetical protein
MLLGRLRIIHLLDSIRITIEFDSQVLSLVGAAGFAAWNGRDDMGLAEPDVCWNPDDVR